MSDAVPDIAIEIETHYLKHESHPAEERFVFAYTIKITNLGPEPVQLLSRYWRITDGNEEVQEVYGEGVVGEQPNIAIGDTYQYTSGAILKTAVGTMEGYYYLITETGEHFEAPVPTFGLVNPNHLH